MLDERTLTQGELWQAFLEPEPEQDDMPTLISVYTRDQALEDGVLVDVTRFGTFAGGGGFKVPVIMTRTLYDLCESIPKKQSHQDVNGRVHDVVWMAFNCFRSLVKAIDAEKLTAKEASIWYYDLILHHGRYVYVTLKMQFDGQAVTLDYAWSGKRNSKKRRAAGGWRL